MKLVSILFVLISDIILPALATLFAPEICCGDLGCFPLGYPWTSVLRPLPILQCADECPAKLLMFFRPNISDMHHLTWPVLVTSLNATPFDGSKPIVMHVPGFGYNWTDPWNVHLKDAYLKRMDVNYIFFDWGGCNFDWRNSLASMRVFAAQGVRFLKYFVQHHGAHPSRFHIIGHSWGAHLASYISRNIKGVNRLTGLDPASFHFWSTSREIMIDVGDAEFVEIGHTEVLPILGYGIREPRGNVDYYFNGNWLQPRCIKDSIPETLRQKKDIFSLLKLPANVLRCGHIRALTYYIEAITETNCTLWGQQMNKAVNILNTLTSGNFAKYTTSLEHCEIESCSPWGFKAPEYPARGLFSVTTADNPPYCFPRPQLDKRMAKSLKEYKKTLFKN